MQLANWSSVLLLGRPDYHIKCLSAGRIKNAVGSWELRTKGKLTPVRTRIYQISPSLHIYPFLFPPVLILSLNFCYLTKYLFFLFIFFSFWIIRRGKFFTITKFFTFFDQFWSKIENFVRNRNFDRKSKFWSNFGRKSNFWSKIEILVENRILIETRNVWVKHRNFGRK